MIQSRRVFSHVVSLRTQNCYLIFVISIIFANKHAGNIVVSTNLNQFVDQRSWEKDKQWGACIMAVDTDGAIRYQIM